MPKKSRRSRVKHRTRGRPRAFAVREASQVQPVPVPSRQAPVAKSAITIGGQADRLRYVPQELRRILIIAGALLVLLIVLSLILR